MIFNCENCTKKVEEKKSPENIPYIVHEAVLDRETRHTKRWMIAFFIAIAILFASNAGWIICESQSEPSNLICNQNNEA